MVTLTEKIWDSELKQYCFTDTDLENFMGGTPASRYGLVNKALKKEEIIRLRRSLYMLATKYLQLKISKFYLANQIVPHSYVSLESALAYHNFIPEKVVQVSSIGYQKRHQHFKNIFGEFLYYSIPINDYEFLTGVTRVEMNKQTFLIASPLRALADVIYLKKIDWQGMDFLTKSLRIEEEDIFRINLSDIDKIKKVYRSKRVIHFLNKLAKEIQSHGI